MALNKVTYVDGETIIGAANLNAIQDEIISQEANKVPTSRKINNNALTSDVTLTAESVGAAPTSHASSATTYGTGTSTNYGHVKLTDSLTDTTTAATGGLALSAKAGKDLMDGKADCFTFTILNSEASTIEEAAAVAYSKITVNGKPVNFRFTWGGQWAGVAYKYDNVDTYGTMYFIGPALGYSYFGYMVNGTFTLRKNCERPELDATQNIFGTVISSMVAPRNLYVGDIVICGDAMYRALTNIDNGATLTPNTNVTRINQTGYRKAITVTPTSTVPITERTYATLATLNLTAGLWLLIGSHDMTAASTDAYQDVFFQSTSTLGVTRNISGAGGGGATTACLFSTATTGYTVVTYQTYGYGTAGAQNRSAQHITVTAIRIF